MPKISNYGNSPSTLCVQIGGLTVWFSYKTPVAFQTDKTGRIVCGHNYSKTTGKHLNLIDGGDKENRVDLDTFQRLCGEHIG